MIQQQNIYHFLSRAGFGPRLIDLQELEKNTLTEIINTSFKNSEKIEYLHIIQPETHSVPNFKTLSDLERRNKIKKSRELILELNTAWIQKMIEDKGFLREKLTLFWHDHFACRTQNPWFAQQLNNNLRKYALDTFENLLFAVSKSPAMLQFLNNQQNRKESPNENFARELLELFTIGRGNYTESDIKNAARAFTGWGFDRQGKFVFRNSLHDFSKKQFMGKSGAFKGEDIIKIILERRETATFITRKIYSYFVNETIDENRLKKLSEHFFNSGYNIKSLLFEIFSSGWFYSNENHKCLIKSPVELLVGLQSFFPIRFRNSKSQLFLQKALGQVLFYPPNVGGWPIGKEWIDSSSLALRMQLPLALGSSNLNNQKFNRGRSQNLEVEINWGKFVNTTNSFDFSTMSVWILGKIPDVNETEIIHSLLNPLSVKETDAIKIARFLALASLPDYQLC